MGTYSVFLILGRHTGRFTGKLIHSNFDWNLIGLKHKLAWLLKPVLSVIDYQLLNSFLLRKEIRPSREKPEYRNFILSGFCANSLKRPTPLKVRNRTFSRSKCKSCHDIDPYKDSRTSKYCDRCNSATCSNHAKILCRQCFAS